MMQASPNIEETPIRDTIPAPPPSRLDFIAEGLYVDLSTTEAEGIIALLDPGE